MKTKSFKIIALLISITLVLSACNSAITSSPEKAPDFNLPAIDGKTISLADFKGKPVFINFWETT